MKKSLTFSAIIALTVLCSCASSQNTATQIYFDTAVTLTADCSDEVLSGAFSLCEEYESTLSRTKENSEISLLTSGKLKVSADTLEVIEKGLDYSRASKSFDITIGALTELWDFKDEVIPSRDEIAEALKNVDYQSVEIIDGEVDTHGKIIDLGGIAKGFVADKLLAYFKENGVKSGIINLGGNITVFGDRYYNVGIKKPFGENEIAATLRLKNKSVSTSGIYERCFEKDGVLYHHILDPATGYPAETDLFCASVIGDTSADCDALGTICVQFGCDKAISVINGTKGYEAVLIDKNYNLHLTDGLEEKDGIITIKKR